MAWALTTCSSPGPLHHAAQSHVVSEPIRVLVVSRSMFRILRGMERNCSSARFSRHGQKHHNGNVTWSCVAWRWWIGWVHCLFTARTDDSWVWHSDYGVSARGQRCVSSFAAKQYGRWNSIVHDTAYGIAGRHGDGKFDCASARNSWLSQPGAFVTEHGAAERNG